MTRAGLLALAAVLILSGCGGGPDNTDPRKGRVTLHKSNCITGGCWMDWKVCFGPDLYVYIRGIDRHWQRASPECKP